MILSPAVAKNTRTSAQCHIVRKKDVERSIRITKPKRQTSPHLVNKKCELGIDIQAELC